MIYELFYPLKFHYSWLSFLNVLRYIPFRTIMATITAMGLSFMLAPFTPTGLGYVGYSLGATYLVLAVLSGWDHHSRHGSDRRR